MHLAHNLGETNEPSHFSSQIVHPDRALWRDAPVVSLRDATLHLVTGGRDERISWISRMIRSGGPESGPDEIAETGISVRCQDVFTFVYSGVDVDWRHGADHMLQRHGVRVNEVAEALADPDAVLFSPDPKSRSGSSARLLGYCASRGQVLVIIMVAREDKLGAWWGATGWVATNADRGRYRRENENE